MKVPLPVNTKKLKVLFVSAPEHGIGQGGYDLFQSLFDETGWERVAAEFEWASDKSVFEQKIKATECDVVFLHYPLAEVISSNEMQQLLNLLQEKEIPIVLFVPVVSPEAFHQVIVEWRTAGFIEQYDDNEAIITEVSSIIGTFKASDREQEFRNELAWIGEELLNYCLAHPSVCFRHWGCFGKIGEDVFEPQALQFLLQYDWRRNGMDLPAVLRSALFKIYYAQKGNKITLGHLPQRFFEDGKAFAAKFEAEQKFLEENSDRIFLDKVEKGLRNELAWTTLLAQQGMTALEFKEKIREVRKERPDMLTRQNYPNIYNFFGIRIWVEAAGLSINDSKHFVDIYLSALQYHYAVNVIHLLEEREKVFGGYAQGKFEDQHIFIFFVCEQFLSNPALRARLHFAYLLGKEKVILVYLKESAIQLLEPQFIKEDFFPKTGLPLAGRDQSAHFKDLILLLRDKIETIWAL